VRTVPVQLPAGWDYGHVFGQMPQTATPARLFLLVAAAVAALAVLFRRLGSGDAS
jgi:hypothetical protein